MSTRDWRLSHRGILQRWIESSRIDRRGVDFFASISHAGIDLDDRLCRLFAIACCRRLEKRSQIDNDIIAEVERLVDKYPLAELREVPSSALEPVLSIIRPASDAARFAAFYASKYSENEYRVQGEILISFVWPRWVFSPSWISSTVAAIATEMYDSRDFSAMPILADALADAGCDRRSLLRTLRNPRRYWYRGNRVTDEILGKRNAVVV